MADLSDVEAALVALIGQTLYPNGNEAPSVIGLDAKVYAGWPQPAELDSDLAAEPPVAHVSVYPRPEEHNLTRYFLKWQEASRNIATLSLSISQSETNPFTGESGSFPTVTVAGASGGAANPQNAMLLVNGKPYLYAVQLADTPATIAAAFAALIGDDLAGVSAVGPVLTLPSTARLQAARIGVSGTAKREVRRQERLFQIGIWAATPTQRDLLAKAVDGTLAGTFWLALADGSSGHLVYRSSPQSDALSRERAYRRVLLYTVEYATFQQQSAPQIIATELAVEGEIAGAPPPELIATLYS